MFKQLRRELGGNGELPLLTSSELSFLDEVKEVVDRKVVESAPLYLQNEANRNTEVMQVISASESNLMTIVTRLKNAKKSKLRFAKTYPKWKGKREECIAKLTEIANAINSNRFNCNVSKLVGYCTSAVGGGMTLASAILMPFSFGLTAPLAVAGGSLIIAGCGTAMGTSVTELALLKSKVDQAKKLIDEDKEYFEDLDEWITRASELQEALESVLSTDVLKDVADSVEKFVKKAVKIKHDHERRRRIERNIGEILRNFIPQFEHLAVPIVAIATYLTSLVAGFLLLLNTENRIVFYFSSITVRNILGVTSIIDDTMDIIRLSRLFPYSAAAAKNFPREITGGAVAVVGIALDVIGIVAVSKDINAGSLSPEAEKVKDAAKRMEEEVNVFAIMYHSLTTYTEELVNC